MKEKMIVRLTLYAKDVMVVSENIKRKISLDKMQEEKNGCKENKNK